MSRSVRMPIARSSWSITTTEPTLSIAHALRGDGDGLGRLRGDDRSAHDVGDGALARCRSGRVGHAPESTTRRTASRARPARRAVAAGTLRESDRAFERLARRQRGLRVPQLDAHGLVERRAPLLVADESRSSRRQTRRERGELVRERRRAASSAPPGSVSRLASPMRSASSPLTPRPVRMRSSACEWPIRRGRRTVPPSMSGTPQRRQNTPNTASRAATRRSHHSASSSPPATA